MRFTAFLLLPFAVMADPCSRLCEIDGPTVCTGGSYNKYGVCNRYLFLGDPSLNNICYHTSATASTCPSSGKPVSVDDAWRLVELKDGHVRFVRTTTRAPPRPPAVWMEGRVGVVRTTTPAPTVPKADDSVDDLEYELLCGSPIVFRM